MPADPEEPQSTSENALAPGLYLVATQKLLNHFEITTPTVSCHQHNEHQRAAELIAALKAGGRIAVVSDAGMPGISDPGSWLTAEAIAAGVAVIPIPGANAALSALVASGLSTDEFHFIGFLPEKAGARRTRLEALAAEVQKNEAARTLVFYEAPHRILETLTDLESVFGPALRVVVARELTKIHEEFLRGTVAEARQELAGRDRIRGEITLLVDAQPRAQGQVAGSVTEKIADRVARLQNESGVDEKEALKRIARELGQSKSDVYRELQRERAKRR
jgi:16S rRNA (cytidine1402-2'-O)-methyltransferase